MMSDADVHQAVLQAMTLSRGDVLAQSIEAAARGPVHAVGGFGLHHNVELTHLDTSGAERRYLCRCEGPGGDALFECTVDVQADSTPEIVTQFVREKFAAFLERTVR